MLVLSRQKNERIVIGLDIIVEIVEIGRGKVRVGVLAPKEVSVHREEIFNKIQEERNKQHE